MIKALAYAMMVIFFIMVTVTFALWIDRVNEYYGLTPEKRVEIQESKKKAEERRRELMDKQEKRRQEHLEFLKNLQNRFNHNSYGM